MEQSSKKSTVYIETSVVSYFTNKISTVIKIAGDQQTTRAWWDKILPKMTPYISDYVLIEIGNGAVNESLQRKQVVAAFEILLETPAVIDLATLYLKKLSIPKRAELDAYHLAIATIYELDFLVSWNCKHIANAFMLKPIQKINDGLGLSTPVICVPTAMMENEK